MSSDTRPLPQVCPDCEAELVGYNSVLTECGDGVTRGTYGCGRWIERWLGEKAHIGLQTPVCKARCKAMRAQCDAMRPFFAVPDHTEGK